MHEIVSDASEVSVNIFFTDQLQRADIPTFRNICPIAFTLAHTHTFDVRARQPELKNLRCQEDR